MIRQIEIFRFLAFLIIFCHHAPMLSGLDVHCFGRFASAAVSFFICLSGFLSAYCQVVSNKPIVLSLQAEVKYVFGKVLKFYPFVILHFVYSCVIRNGFIFGTFCACDWDKLKDEVLLCIKVLTLTISWFSVDSSAFGLQWFFSTLLFLYVMQKPLLYLLGKIKHSPLMTVLFFCVLPLLVMSIVSSYVYPHCNAAHWLYRFPPSRLAEYMTGMAIGALCARFRAPSELCRTRIFYTVIEIVAVVIWLGFPFTRILCRGWDDWAIRWAISNSLLLFMFGFGRGAISELFAKKPFVALGAFAMPCFWLHPMIIHLCSQSAIRFRHAGYVPCAVALVLTMIIAAFLVGVKEDKGKISYSVRVAWGALLLLLVIPGTVKLTHDYWNSTRVSVVLEKGSNVPRYGVYYMTEDDPSFSERKHLIGKKPTELADGRKKMSFRLSPFTRFQIVIPVIGNCSIHECHIGSRLVSTNMFSVIQIKKNGCTVIAMKDTK